MRDYSDKELLDNYMLGFNDELNSKSKSFITESLLLKAYNLGKTDALIGDDLRSVDYQTNDEILNRIKL